MRKPIFACKLARNASYLLYMFINKPLNKLLFVRAVRQARMCAYLLIGGAIG